MLRYLILLMLSAEGCLTNHPSQFSLHYNIATTVGVSSAKNQELFLLILSALKNDAELLHYASGISKLKVLAPILLACFLLVSVLARANAAVAPNDSLSIIHKLLQSAPVPSVKTLNYYSELVNDLSHQPGDTTLLATVFNQLGGNYYMQARYDQALNKAHKALRLYLRVNDTSGLYKLYHNMGVIYEANKDYEQAMNYLTLAYQMMDRRLESNPNDSNALRIRPGLYNNLGIVSDNMGEVEMAMQFYEKAMTHSHEVNDETVLLTSGLNIGILYGKLGDYPEALAHIQLAYELALKNEEHYHLANIYNNLGDIRLKMNDFSKANAFFEKALSQARDVNANEYIKNAYLGLFQTQQAIGNLGEAIRFQSLYYLMRDSITSYEVREYFARLEYRFEMERKEDELKILAIENEIIGQRLRMKTLTQRYLGAGFFLLIVVSVVLFILNRVKQQAINDLVRKNLEIVQHESSTNVVARKSRPEELHILPGEATPEKYAQSSLTADHKERLIEVIERNIQNEKPYLNKDFNLNQFAQSLGFARSYVSQAINGHYGKNFSSWVNEYRIREARRMMANPENRRLTIEAIAQAAGFASKSSFNEAFKKYTGLTPSVFMKRVSEID